MQAWLKALPAALADFATDSLNSAQLDVDVALTDVRSKPKSDKAQQQLAALVQEKRRQSPFVHAIILHAKVRSKLLG